jgi:hypothetical protein
MHAKLMLSLVAALTLTGCRWIGTYTEPPCSFSINGQTVECDKGFAFIKGDSGGGMLLISTVSGHKPSAMFEVISKGDPAEGTFPVSPDVAILDVVLEDGRLFSAVNGGDPGKEQIGTVEVVIDGFAGYPNPLLDGERPRGHASGTAPRICLDKTAPGCGDTVEVNVTF